MKVYVDKGTCIGCGTCVAIAPKSFKLDETGKSEPIDPAGDPEEMIKEAVNSCPVRAITILEE